MDSNWQDKLVSPEEVLAHIKPGMTIFLGSGFAEPRTLIKRLIESGLPDINDLEFIQLTSYSDFLSLSDMGYGNYRLKTFFSSWVSSEAVVSSSVDLVLCHRHGRSNSQDVSVEAALPDQQPPLPAFLRQS